MPDEPIQLTFAQCWWSILRQVPKLSWRSANRLRTIAAVLILIVAALSKQWGRLISDKWQGIPGKYVLTIIGLFLVWEIMHAIYKRDCDELTRLHVFDTSSETKKAAAAHLSRLDGVEKAEIKRMLAAGSMNEGHAMEYILSLPDVRQGLGPLGRNEILGPISRKTNLLIKDMVGNYDINPTFRNALLELLADD